jgi:hypothetical protein
MINKKIIALKQLINDIQRFGRSSIFIIFIVFFLTANFVILKITPDRSITTSYFSYDIHIIKIFGVSIKFSHLFGFILLRTNFIPFYFLSIYNMLLNRYFSRESEEKNLVKMWSRRCQKKTLLLTKFPQIKYENYFALHSATTSIFNLSRCVNI